MQYLKIKIDKGVRLFFHRTQYYPSLFERHAYRMKMTIKLKSIFIQKVNHEVQ